MGKSISLTDSLSSLLGTAYILSKKYILSMYFKTIIHYRLPKYILHTFQKKIKLSK